MKILIMITMLTIAFLLTGCTAFNEGVKTLSSDTKSSGATAVDKPVNVNATDKTNKTKDVGVAKSNENSGEYSLNIMDSMLRKCNLACCGEETPASCSKECRWPKYVECFHGCMDNHPDASYNCDAECWPEHKVYFDAATKACQKS